jgi:NAD(P)-dependent dehydrogenase (short-subunit alcohol dehydrogenase family)
VAAPPHHRQPGGEEFAGRFAFVSGAGSGIGAAVAVALAERGAVVALGDVDLDAILVTATTIRERGGNVLPVLVDVAEPAAVDEAFATVLEEFGALHLAVNSAGVGSYSGTLVECDNKNWQRVLDINLSGVFHCLRREIPAIVAAGGGAIVNVSSLAGERGCAGMGPYVAAKHGVAGLTRTAALEYAGAGVRVNAVAPGPVETPMLAALDDDTRRDWAAAHPLGRIATSADVAAMCLFLLSERASMISGGHHLVDGGLSLL